MKRERVLILGAAGRDFHNFNVYYRDNDSYEVAGFTATQIPQIADRMYPPELAGRLYPKGIPIYAESELENLIHNKDIHRCVLAYSDLNYQTVMHLASRCMAAGADFGILGPRKTMIKASVPVVAVCAVRTGCGKSQTSRYVANHLRRAGLRVVAIRHPMPYGNLADQVVERYAELADLDRYHCTIEEREEYESHILNGTIVYAGVDYGAILEQAQKEADVIIWDGGNNDWPFYVSDLWITVADPFRPGHELEYFPGEVNFRAADVILINKVNDATAEGVKVVEENAHRVNPDAVVIKAASALTVSDPKAIKGKRVVCVEDGPTLTHGEMPFGAGTVAARKFGAAEIIDPRPFAVGSILDTYNKYPKAGPILPAMGYFPQQIKDLEDTINRIDCDLVVIATPINLGKLIHINKPTVQVGYELEDMGEPTLGPVLDKWLDRVR